ncbi:MAG: YidH family protein [Desulfococcaceae bacterium]
MANKKKHSECGSPPADQQRRINSDELRTHMANERTFLSWCRTSLALVVFGFVLSRFEIFIRAMEHSGLKISTQKMMSELRLAAFFSFVLAGAIILISGWRFLYVRKKIIRGEITVSIFPEIMVILSMTAIIALVIVLLTGTI